MRSTPSGISRPRTSAIIQAAFVFPKVPPGPIRQTLVAGKEKMMRNRKFASNAVRWAGIPGKPCPPPYKKTFRMTPPGSRCGAFFVATDPPAELTGDKNTVCDGFPFGPHLPFAVPFFLHPDKRWAAKKTHWRKKTRAFFKFRRRQEARCADKRSCIQSAIFENRFLEVRNNACSPPRATTSHQRWPNRIQGKRQ